MNALVALVAPGGTCFVWASRVLLHIPALLMVVVATAGCGRAPEDPYELFIYELEQKTETLFDHMDNADDLMDGEHSLLSNGRMVSAETKFYRYKHIGPAAQDVYDHFASPTMAFYLTISSADEVDDTWRIELAGSVENEREELAEHLAAFGKRMPRDPPEPEQSSELGGVLESACTRGSMLSQSEMCRIGRYGYDEEDRLYFEISEGRIYLDHLLDIDVDEWLTAVRAAQSTDA